MIRNDVKGFYSAPIVGCQKSNWDSPKQRKAIQKRLAMGRGSAKAPRFIDTFCDILDKEKTDVEDNKTQ